MMTQGDRRRGGLHGLCQPGPVEQGSIGLEALIGKALVDGQKQGGRQADAVGVAHHHLAAIGAQPLLQLRQTQPGCLSLFIPDLEHGHVS